VVALGAHPAAGPPAPADRRLAQVAKHYGVEVWVCPPRRPQRKGVVEAAPESAQGDFVVVEKPTRAPALPPKRPSRPAPIQVPLRTK
jgi:transposase